MEITEKTKIIILSLCILVILSLSAAIVIKGKDNSCETCYINFKQTNQFGTELDEPILIKERPLDLFDSLINDKCIISWDENQGYIKNG